MESTDVSRQGESGSGRARFGHARREAVWLIAGLSAYTLFIVAVELRILPPLRYAWGLSLWAYLPDPAIALLAGGTLLWLVPRVRSAAVTGVAGLLQRVRSEHRVLFTWAGYALFACALYLFRERLAFGDSRIIYWSMNANPSLFFFPDIGATFFLQTGYRIGRWTGIGGLPLVQGFICLCGSLTLYLFVRIARELARTRAQAVLIVSLVLANGAARTFAGHIEVYGFVMLSVGAFVLAALRHLRGEVSWVWVALAFGAGLWVHIQYLFLIPSLMFVLSATPALQGAPFARHFARWSVAACVTFAPTLLFFAALLATGQGQDLVAAVEKMQAWSEVGPTEGHEAWIRFWGGDGAGTRYAIFSAAHTKYLTNSFFLLAPFTLPLAFVTLRAKALLWDSAPARFFGSASATSLLYAFIVRPVYGPYDWDLFSLTAAFVALWIGQALVRILAESLLRDVAALTLGVALLTTSFPLVAVGVRARSEVGPFSVDMVERKPGEDFDATFERNLGPWL